MRRKRFDIIAALIVIAVFVAVISIDKFIFETVTESNLPEWVKWMLLH